MPTYEYLCRGGHAFERFQSMHDKPVRRCPECGKSAKRQMSAGGALLFRGSGFYITDYRSSEYKEKARAEGVGGNGKAAPSDSSKKPGDVPAPAKTAKKSASKGKT
ncbi:MAG: zinc ribbon domain-containing protein [Planctomycetes bacterium]|nr:zinc ribbon domain-containing protein [Planctomycetota bacterium]